MQSSLFSDAEKQMYFFKSLSTLLYHIRKLSEKARGGIILAIRCIRQQEQAAIMLSSHFYESRDGSTGGFFADNVQAGQQVWNTVNTLLRLDRDWKVGI